MKWVAITTPCMCVFSSSLYSETGTKNTIKNKSGKEKNKGEKVTHLHTRMFRAELFGVCLYGFLVTHAIEDFQCISYRPWRVAVAAALDWLGLTYKRQHLAKQKKNKNTRIKKKMGNATEAANPGNQREKNSREVYGAGKKVIIRLGTVYTPFLLVTIALQWSVSQKDERFVQLTCRLNFLCTKIIDGH